jgi:tetratricopeptide (TPR) repeat protein
MRRYEEAISDLNRVVKLEDRLFYRAARYRFALTTRANTYWEMNKREEAIKDYEILLQINANNVQPAAKRATVYRLLKQYDRAISTAKSAIETNQNDIPALESLAETYWDMEMYDEAIATYTQVLDLKPDMYRVRALRGNIYRINKQYEKAIEDLSLVLASDPKDAYALRIRGRTYFEMGKLTDALREWNRLLEIDHQHDYALKMRDHVYCLIIRNVINFGISEYEKAWGGEVNGQWMPKICQAKDNMFSNPFACIADNTIAILTSSSLLWRPRGRNKLLRLLWARIVAIIGATVKEANDMQMFALMNSIRILLFWGIRWKPKLQDPYRNCWETILSQRVSR